MADLLSLSRMVLNVRRMGTLTSGGCSAGGAAFGNRFVITGFGSSRFGASGTQSARSLRIS